MNFSKSKLAAASALTASLFLITPSSFAATTPSAVAGKVELHGTLPAKLVQAKRVGILPSERVLHFTVALALPNESGMKTFVQSLYDPSSPDYHHFLAPGEFTDRFGPSQAAYDQVVEFLQSQGLQVIQQHANRMLVDVQGPGSAIERAFDVQMNDYQIGNRTVYAPSGEVSVPLQLAGLISGVIGLDNFGQMVSEHTVRSTNPKAATATSGYTPQQIHTAYDYAPLYSAGINGSGQTIAVATAYTYSSSDINSFDSAFGLPTPNVSNINVDGTPNQTNDETTLDLEWSHATAPNARILMYQAANSSLTDFTDVYNRIATDDTASTVTTSWGTSEDNMSTQTLNTDDNIFYQMAAQGQSVFAASGDNGATDGSYYYLETDYPSIDPYVTACGGTTLQLGSGNTYGSETSWSGSGGGESDYFGEPSWQYGTNVPQDGWRQSPDIALNADPNTGYSYFYNGSWGVAGGTSFVAPQMAGTFALVDQAHGGRIGEADPALYNLARTSYSDFHDVTSGNNGYYNAGPDYDNVTGWGSIDAYAFVNGLK